MITYEELKYLINEIEKNNRIISNCSDDKTRIYWMGQYKMLEEIIKTMQIENISIEDKKWLIQSFINISKIHIYPTTIWEE